VSEKNENSELNLNSESENTTSDSDESKVPVLDEDILASTEEIDQILAEEAPDFLNELSSLKIDSAGINLSVMDQALDVLQTEVGAKIVLKRTIDISANPKIVGFFWGSVVLAVVALLGIWQIKKSFLDAPLFVTSFQQLGATVQDYNSVEVESFYDNPRIAKNLLTLPNIYVNLKTSENSGATPMLAVEFIIEGMSSEATIEVKDREAEFKDLIARALEEKTYDDLLEAKGKTLQTDQLRDLINTNLTKGQVRKVLYKTFIIKP
jgi:flagellar basal body-associated protein FliL